MHTKLAKFLHSDSTSGILLIITTILALIFVNSPFSHLYNSFLHIPMEIRVGALHIDKTLHHWINDGLMAIFFLMVGLEVKREILDGHLSSIGKVALPTIAAIGGIIVPALVYTYFNQGDIEAMKGWAIPTATDIAFALGILSLLGNRVPLSLKIFLMALAIIDDLGAIVIIAIFYTAELSHLAIVVASLALITLVALNLLGFSRKSLFFMVGLVLWVAVLKSGVHATLAGVAFAFTIPLVAKDKSGNEFSPLREIESGLHPWIVFFILPLFAFANAGIDIRDISIPQITDPVPMGIMLGLFLGKQIGVFGFSWIAIKLKITSLPEGSSWFMLYGVSILTGIGFTMSLFIDSLAFTDDRLFAYTDKLAILIGTFLSATIGYLLLKYTLKKSNSLQKS
ncbi:Na+/H+ antiporter NhaA type [hydrothermal vent metagenome]|uniref:Na+/H+ antiporter NhaA type n=1 Tax=hydrothermal vent metagenome TaxID=652676 RepID=A0A1W1BV56_9ZZZZ